MNLTKLKHPSAFAPILMSLAALILVLWHVAVSGVAREADEGTAAHLFQLLMAGQVPLVAFFVVKYFRSSPGQTFSIIGLQIAVALLALAPVFILGL
ncbi:MAG TPA: hypothetical protein VGO25_03105 [Rhodanobacteraceae bacterium]|nr:hypothetical protein [Rhodanobacteraceae bacterium]